MKKNTEKKIKLYNDKRKIQIFNRIYKVENSPYIYRYKNKIVLKEDAVFWAEYEHLEDATYDERMFQVADKYRIEALLRDGRINNYFEVIEVKA